MQNLIIIILLIGLCIAITLLILRRKEIEAITNKLKDINSRDTNEELRVGYPNSNVEKLIEEINRTLRIKNDTESSYKEMDLELRQAIANISHDLRTPLTSIIGYIQLMGDENINCNEKEEYLSIIEKRSQNLKELISSFYDLSRLQADEYIINLEEINISSVLCELLASFYNDINKNGLDPKINIEENIPLVYGDKNAINRIFSNLIQNVLKHGKGRLEIDLLKEGNSILINFSNEAPDLSSDDASRIFERFFTADRMRTGQNTGLGLAITKMLVEKQGGKIWAEKKADRLYIKIRWQQI